LINIAEYAFHNIFGFIGIKNRATPKRDIDQANKIQKPFHNRITVGLMVVVKRFLFHERVFIFTDTR
jgi:hypothetical protein